MSYNICIIMGNVTRDPEIKYTPKGTACCDFGIAVNKVWFDANNKKCESVSFFDVVAWDKGAEWAGEYLKKGAAILIEGELQQDTWDDKETGQKRSKVRIRARKLTPCFATWKDGGRQPKDEDAGHTQGPAQRPAAPPAGRAHQPPRRPPADPDLDGEVDGDGIPF